MGNGLVRGMNLENLILSSIWIDEYGANVSCSRDNPVQSVWKEEGHDISCLIPINYNRQFFVCLELGINFAF